MAVAPPLPVGVRPLAALLLGITALLAWSCAGSVGRSSPAPHTDSANGDEPGANTQPLGDAAIIYTTDDGLYSIRADGTGARKLFNAEDEWEVSPDGAKVAYWQPPSRRGDPAKIYVSRIPDEEPELFLEGSYLLEGWVGSGQFLWVRGPEQKEQLVRYDSGRPGETLMVGGWDSITLRDELVVVTCEGETTCSTKVRNLLTGTEATYPGDPRPLQPCNVSSGACWSPDFRTAAYLDDEGYMGILHVLGADSGVSAPLASGVGDATAVPSPDGRMVAFLQYELLPGGLYSICTLFVVDVTGGEPRALTRPGVIGKCRRPVWSSDSERIYFALESFADFAVNTNGNDGHRVQTGEVAYCWTAGVGLATLKDPTSIIHSRPAVGFGREDYPGIVALARKTPLLSEIQIQDSPGCVVSGDSRFALGWSDGTLRVFDLMNGGDRTIVNKGVRSAAWAGGCATTDCWAAAAAPTVTPFAGELPSGVTSVEPFEAKLSDPVEHGFHSSPSRSEPANAPRTDSEFTVIGRVEADGLLWYYLSPDSQVVPSEARYVLCRYVEPCDERGGDLPQQALVELGEGDTLCTVATAYDLTAKEILDYNPDIDPNNLNAGDFLNIPRPVFTPPPTDC